jgi:hypothetical protein
MNYLFVGKMLVDVNLKYDKWLFWSNSNSNSYYPEHFFLTNVYIYMNVVIKSLSHHCMFSKLNLIDRTFLLLDNTPWKFLEFASPSLSQINLHCCNWLMHCIMDKEKPGKKEREVPPSLNRSNLLLPLSPLKLAFFI